MRETNNKIKYFSFWIATFVLLLLIFITELRALGKTNGHFCYPLDDTFIHLSIAKNLLKYGVWGVNSGEFAGASSSPLYPLLLAGVGKLVGLNVYIPFIINFITSILTLFVIFKILNTNFKSHFILSLSLISIIFFTPLMNMVVLGMEHTLHILFSLLLFYEIGKIANATQKNRRNEFFLLLWGFLNVATRYEGAFLVACICFLLWAEKKWRLGAFLAVFSALPILLYGLFSLKNGGDFLPNSLLLKQKHSLFEVEGLKRLLKAPYEEGFWISSLLLMNSYLILKNLAKETSHKNYIFLFIGASLFHFLFPHFGGFYRYEAYLIPLGMVGLCIYMGKNSDFLVLYVKTIWQKKTAFIFLLIISIFLFFPLFYRAATAFFLTPTIITNIYQQQTKMAAFLHQYYDNQVVADNDIGAICFYTEVKNIDLFGLGNNKIFWAKRNRTYSGDFLRNYVEKKNAKIALFYQASYTGEEANLYKNWVKVGEWHLENNYVCASDDVAFFAIDSSEVAYLRKSLKAFETLAIDNPKLIEK